jgi:hypothetical protein
MESDRFDALLHRLMQARSRRGALTGLVGGSLSLLRAAEIAGKRKHKKKKKRRSLPASPLPLAPPSPPTSPPPSPLPCPVERQCSSQCCADGQFCQDDGCLPCTGQTCPAQPSDFREGCCESFVCDPGTQRCEPCRGTGGNCSDGNGGQSNSLCCDGYQCSSEVCRRFCTTAEECDPGEDCCINERPPGVCLTVCL